MKLILLFYYFLKMKNFFFILSQEIHPKNFSLQIIFKLAFDCFTNP